MSHFSQITFFTSWLFIKTCKDGFSWSLSSFGIFKPNSLFVCSLFLSFLTHTYHHMLTQTCVICLSLLHPSVACSCASLWWVLLECSTETGQERIHKSATAASPQTPPPLNPSAWRSPGTKPPAGTRCRGTETGGRSGDPGPQSHSGLGRSAQGWDRRRRGQPPGKRQSGGHGREETALVSRGRWTGGGLQGWCPAHTLGW